MLTGVTWSKTLNASLSEVGRPGGVTGSVLSTQKMKPPTKCSPSIRNRAPRKNVSSSLVLIYVFLWGKIGIIEEEEEKEIAHCSIPHILIPCSVPDFLSTGTINYNNKTDREVAYSGKADIASIPLDTFYFWQVTFFPRVSVRNQHLPAEQHYLPLFFMFRDSSGNDVTISVWVWQKALRCDLISK